MQPARGRLRNECDHRDREGDRESGNRRERHVRLPLQSHAQRDAHATEQQRREERQPYGGYTASSACSGVGLPRAKSGTKTCASGPIESA